MRSTKEIQYLNKRFCRALPDLHEAIRKKGDDEDIRQIVYQTLEYQGLTLTQHTWAAEGKAASTLVLEVVDTQTGDTCVISTLLVPQTDDIRWAAIHQFSMVIGIGA